MATLLVIESTAEGRTYLVSIIRDCGHDVLEASDPVKGLEIAGRMRPDLVLTNAFLGSMDGYDLVRRLRAKKGTKGIPVILFAGARDEWLARAIARASDVEFVIARPGDRDAVTSAIKAALRGASSVETSSEAGHETQERPKAKSPARRAAGG